MFYQLYEDRRTYFLYVDVKQKVFSVMSQTGKHFRQDYKTVDSSGYLCAMKPILIEPLNYTFKEGVLK